MPMSSGSDAFYLRQATVADLTAIMDIERQAFIPQIQESEDTFRERIIAFSTGFLILEDRSQDVAVPAGYFSSEIWCEPADTVSSFELGHSALQSHDGSGTVLYISSMALSNRYRGHGLGRMLFIRSCTQVLDCCPQISLLQLLVNTEWKKAQAIYRSAGFSETARLSGFFSTATPEYTTDGIVMSCSREAFL